MSKKHVITVLGIGFGLLLIAGLTSCIDGTAPQPVQSFKLRPGDGKVVLTWENPPDKDLIGVMVCRKTGIAPKEPLDGVVVISAAVDEAEDIELENDQTYYYAVWTFDYVGNFSEAVHGTATPRAPKTVLMQEEESATEERGGEEERNQDTSRAGDEISRRKGQLLAQLKG